VYPTVENSPELCISSKINGEDATTRAADYAKTHAKVPVIDYVDKVEVKIKEEPKKKETSYSEEAEKYISEFNALKPKKREIKEKKKKKEVTKVISNELF
jgi:ABC-type Fe2+-enterobactin transport system substrate-binding protein